jgi:hypothetical protein
MEEGWKKEIRLAAGSINLICTSRALPYPESSHSILPEPQSANPYAQ